MSHHNTYRAAFCLGLMWFLGMNILWAGPLVVGMSADYPPMAFREGEKIQGFEVDLAQLIATEMGQELEIKDMPFSSLFPSLNAGQVDMVISSVTATPLRAQNFDFSDVYYAADLALMFRKDHEPALDLKGVKVGCQSGSIMALWVEQQAPGAEAVFMDLNPPLVEALKSGHLMGVVLERAQASAFSTQDPALAFKNLGQAPQGYAIVMPKGSRYTAQVNGILERRKTDIEKLKQQWNLF